jgi:outer membrane receptor protein involved in Fe transport
MSAKRLGWTVGATTAQIDSVKTTICQTALLCVLCHSIAVGQAQTPDSSRDSVRVPRLDTVVVTPARSATTVRTSTVAVSVLPGALVRELPVRSIPAALVVAPGVAVIDANSVGGSPRVIVRGFYGGGETDYLPALIDGVPTAALGSGAVDWDVLTRRSVGRLELVRGGSSYIHGDAAPGGALDLVTGALPALAWRVDGGAYGLRSASAGTGYDRNSQHLNLDFDHLSSAGYRAHEARSASTLNARLAHNGANRSITAFASTHTRTFDDPGPLPSTTDDRRAANAFFRFDRATEQLHRAGVTVAQDIGDATASGYLVGEYASGNTVKTLPLSPDFGDTKLRRTRAPRLMGSTQLRVGDDSPGWKGRLVTGVDLSLGKLESRYADVASGTSADYSAADGAAGALGPWSSARRDALGAFVYWQVRPMSAVRVSLSTRLDHLRDAFNPSDAAAPATTTSQQAISPRAAVNVALPALATETTNLYVSTGRVFKAATLDQLFDERAIPIPVPPFSTTVSNSSLVPQRGTATEAGFYQTWRAGASNHLDLSGAVYRQRMRDELDFDVASFRYVNIGRSLHRGVELGGTFTNSWSIVLASIARQDVLAEAGQFNGRQLKAIPRRIAAVGADFHAWRGFNVGVLANSLGGAFIDDENTRPLSAYTRIDARLGVPIGFARVTLDAMNVFDRRYDATAFPDPAGSGINYRYPAAGRVFIVGLESKQ